MSVVKIVTLLLDWIQYWHSCPADSSQNMLEPSFILTPSISNHSVPSIFLHPQIICSSTISNNLRTINRELNSLSPKGNWIRVYVVLWPRSHRHCGIRNVRRKNRSTRNPQNQIGSFQIFNFHIKNTKKEIPSSHLNLRNFSETTDGRAGGSCSGGTVSLH